MNTLCTFLEISTFMQLLKSRNQISFHALNLYDYIWMEYSIQTIFNNRALALIFIDSIMSSFLARLVPRGFCATKSCTTNQPASVQNGTVNFCEKGKVHCERNRNLPMKYEGLFLYKRWLFYQKWEKYFCLMF